MREVILKLVDSLLGLFLCVITKKKKKKKCGHSDYRALSRILDRFTNNWLCFFFFSFLFFFYLLFCFVRISTIDHCYSIELNNNNTLTAFRYMLFRMLYRGFNETDLSILWPFLIMKTYLKQKNKKRKINYINQMQPIITI